ncbi:MAG: tyrosine recombinase [Clostridia bacterium]|nr:tyrosine recombinase [Clostridia bacterium]
MYEALYEEYLKKEKKLSENSCLAYIRDLNQFEAYVNGRGIIHLNEVSNADVVSYVMSMKQQDMSKSTINRRLASVRAYYRFLIKNGIMTKNPTDEVKTPRVEKKEIEFLSVEDMEKLLELPDGTDKGIRDRALLELLYATGIRATEIINLKLSDLNLRMGFVKCDSSGSKARIIPVGRLAKKALEDYVLDVRDKLKAGESEYLFFNYMGEPLSRQGLWKILKEYGEKAQFSIGLTPQVIRNSFAVHMLQNGADVKSLQELMGHDDISATQAYLAVTKNRIKDVYDRSHPRA